MPGRSRTREPMWPGAILPGPILGTWMPAVSRYVLTSLRLGPRPPGLKPDGPIHIVLILPAQPSPVNSISENVVPDHPWKVVRSAAFQGMCPGILLDSLLLQSMALY